MIESHSLGEERPRSLGGGKGRWITVALVGFVLLITAFAVATDGRRLASALRGFTWGLIVPILALTLWNYAWRFVKWQLYLRELAVAPLPTRLSLRIFLAGFAMSITPGKVGELVKAVYLRRFTGSPVNRMSAIVVAERASDALAMMILAALAATDLAYGRSLILLLALAAIAAILVLQRPGVLTALLARVAGWPLVGRVVHHAVAFVEASGTLFRPRILGQAVGLGVVSWTGECVAFFLVLIGLGITATPRLLITATFILAISSLAGGASLLPGGLGIADASIAGMLLLLVKDGEMTRGVATAATLLIRFATLWFAVLIGSVAVASLERRLRRDEREAAPPSGPGVDESVTERALGVSTGRAGTGASRDGGNA